MPNFLHAARIDAKSMNDPANTLGTLIHKKSSEDFGNEYEEDFWSEHEVMVALRGETVKAGKAGDSAVSG